MKAGEAYKPSGRWASLDQIIMHFLTSRERTLAIARTTNDDLRGRNLEAQELDGYQYLLILSAHTQRHARQIEEIKTSADFPR